MSEVIERIPIPGCWRCPRCGFHLEKSLLNPGTGEVFVNPDRRREVCPNDGVTLEQAYESPDDKLVAYGRCECEYDPECLRCSGSGRRIVGWHYRDEERVRSFDDPGDRSAPC